MLLLAAALACAAFVLPGSADPVTRGGDGATIATSELPTVPALLADEPAPLHPLPHPARPLELTIPALGVQAPVVPLVAEGSVLTPPGDVSEVGWWEQGRRPGARRGHVLITGHTVHTGGGVFDRLGELRHGDRIKVRTPQGPQWYHVIAVEYLSIEQLADQSAYLFRLHDWPRLVLVTCAGWDGGDYNGNTVVIARPELGVAGTPSETPTETPSETPTVTPSPTGSLDRVPLPQTPAWYFCPLCDLQSDGVVVPTD